MLEGHVHTRRVLVQRGDRPTATAYVSLISADRVQACVDAQLPLAPETTPFTALVGDRSERTAGQDAQDEQEGTTEANTIPSSPGVRRGGVYPIPTLHSGPAPVHGAVHR